MKFRDTSREDDPDINLIPFIDVLLVIIIFLMLTTTYSRYSGLEISLPTADAAKKDEKPNEINVAVTITGQVLVNRKPIEPADVATISHALRREAEAAGSQVPVVINADAKATYQRVIDIMQAAQQAGLPQISFATQPESTPVQQAPAGAGESPTGQ